MLQSGHLNGRFKQFSPWVLFINQYFASDLAAADLFSIVRGGGGECIMGGGVYNGGGGVNEGGVNEGGVNGGGM